MESKMKYIILAQPKSASTSLLKTPGELIGEEYGQQVFSDNKARDMTGKDRNAGRVAKVLSRCVSPLGLRVVRKSADRSALNRLRDDFPAPSYPLLSSVHVDICDFQDGKLGFTPQFALQKQHFPPTPGNRLAFRKIPKIVLTRDAEDAIDAYTRMTSLPGYFRFFISHDKAIRQALRDEIIDWQEGWKDEVDKHGGLHLTFEDITTRTHESLAAALREFGIEMDFSEIRKVSLARERYTGGGKAKT